LLRGALHRSVYRWLRRLTRSTSERRRLFLDGQLNHDGALREVGNSIYLTAGHHQLEVRMFENAGDAGIRVSYAGPGIPKQVIPPDAFLRRDPVYSSTTAVHSPGVIPGVQPFSAAISNLNVNTPYYYRFVAANDNGTNYGTGQSLTMLHPGTLTALNFDGNNDQVIVNSSAAQTGCAPQLHCGSLDLPDWNCTPLAASSSTGSEQSLRGTGWHAPVGHRQLQSGMGLSTPAWSPLERMDASRSFMTARTCGSTPTACSPVPVDTAPSATWTGATNSGSVATAGGSS
jgi:hypothetical protein